MAQEDLGVPPERAHVPDPQRSTAPGETSAPGEEQSAVGDTWQELTSSALINSSRRGSGAKPDREGCEPHPHVYGL